MDDILSSQNRKTLPPVLEFWNWALNWDFQGGASRTSKGVKEGPKCPLQAFSHHIGSSHPFNVEFSIYLDKEFHSSVHITYLRCIAGAIRSQQFFHWLITYLTKILNPSPLRLRCLSFLKGNHVSEFWLPDLIQNKLSVNVFRLIDWLTIDQLWRWPEGREGEVSGPWLIVLIFKNTLNPVWNCTIWNCVLTWPSYLSSTACPYTLTCIPLPEMWICFCVLVLLCFTIAHDGRI